MSDYDAILRNFVMIRKGNLCFFIGTIYSDSAGRFEDGTEVRTSLVDFDKFKDSVSGDVIQTLNTKYLLD